MGFWSKFGKIGAAVAPFAAMAIPGVGPAVRGALGAGGIGRNLLAAVPAASQIIGGIAQGRAQGRATEATLGQNQDQTRQRMYEALMNAQLGRSRLQSENALNAANFGAKKAEYERDSPSVRFQQALKGGAAANMQDVGIQAPHNVQSHLVQFTGGARPSAIGPQGRQAGRTLADLALASMGKDTFASPEMPNIPELPQQPELTPLPRAGAIDRILGVAGPATAFLGAIPQQQSQWSQQSQTQGELLDPSLLRLGGGVSLPQPSSSNPFIDPNDPLGLKAPNPYQVRF